jgi:ribosomal protein L28
MSGNALSHSSKKAQRSWQDALPEQNTIRLCHAKVRGKA